MEGVGPPAPSIPIRVQAAGKEVPSGDGVND